jgi:cytochrome c oxidase subunit 2
LTALSAGVLVSTGALADHPVPWQMTLQEPASPVARDLQWLHNDLLLPIITVISVVVLFLLLYVSFRFRASANPVPSKTSHNTIIEILWTVLPILILLVIAVPSFKLLYFEGITPKAALTLKVTGHQWYWHYDYPDNGNIGFDSYIVDNDDLHSPTRLLEVDNEVVLPVGENVRILIAGEDVIHSWFVPALAVQKYSIVGHLNEAWVNIEKEGTYYGECNQICGVNHAFMPIKIHAVSKEDFAKWLDTAKTKFAQAPSTQVAAAP